MSEESLVVWVAVLASLVMLTVAIALAEPPVPQKIIVPSPVAGCREIQNVQSWAPKDSTYRYFICPEEE